ISSISIVPWVAVILSLFSAFWSVANPRDDIKALKNEFQGQISELRHDAGTAYLTIAEFREYMIRKDKDTDRTEVALRSIQSEVVPRPEHQQHWNEQADRIAGLRDQLSDLRKEVQGSWNIGKQLDSLQKQIDERRNMRAAATPARPGMATSP